MKEFPLTMDHCLGALISSIPWPLSVCSFGATIQEFKIWDDPGRCTGCSLSSNKLCSLMTTCTVWRKKKSIWYEERCQSKTNILCNLTPSEHSTRHALYMWSRFWLTVLAIADFHLAVLFQLKSKLPKRCFSSFVSQINSYCCLATGPHSLAAPLPIHACKSEFQSFSFATRSRWFWTKPYILPLLMYFK